MTIPLSKLMQLDDPDVGPPVGTYMICLAPKLFEQLEEATARFTEAEARLEQARPDADGDRPAGKQRRVGHKSDAALLEAQAQATAEEADEIRARMSARSVELQLVVDEDAWKDFTREHPAREPSEDPTGARRDRTYAFGLCNVDDMTAVPEKGNAAVTKFITAYGDERPTAESWPFVLANSAAGDRDLLVSKIVKMHTQGVDLGKSRVEWRSSRKPVIDSE